MTTLEGLPEGTITPFRRDGNTSRIADHAIQLLFQGKEVVVHDHFEFGKNHRVNKYLWEKIIDRFRSEYAGIGKNLIKDLICDRDALTIRLNGAPFKKLFDGPHNI